ncbi:2-hydroxyacid dehydrogenase [Myroides odoratus]|uniref:2-hydroxyacid dehydrogenase n=1 Tax=Myroides odoratus TaxID=256 RepID=UPI0039B06195
MKVFLNKRIPEEGMQLLNHKDIELILPKKELLSHTEWLSYCKKSEVILNVGKENFNRKFFDECPNIQAIALYSVGYDHVDIAEATKRKVAISNTPDVLSQATADTAFLLMQMTARKASFNLEKVKKGTWTTAFSPLDNLGQELTGKTLGVFGLGRIGYEMAKKCKYAFDMPIIYHNRRRNEKIEQELNATYVPFDALLTSADVISIHANYTAKENHLFNQEAFKKMKSTAILVNTARGGFVNEQDLYEALVTKTLFGAGLDVTEIEPLPIDSPLLRLDHVNILPHIGSATIQARKGMARLAAENIVAFVEGNPMPTIVNPTIYS